jgi:hypothetical protein
MSAIWPAANSRLETSGEADSVLTQYLFHRRSSMCESSELCRFKGVQGVGKGCCKVRGGSGALPW